VRDQLAGQFKDYPPSDLGPNARDFGERLAIAGVRRNPDRFGLVHRKHGQSQTWTDAANAQQDIENLAFIVIGETEQRKGILTDDHGGEELRPSADFQVAQGLGSSEDAHSRTVEVDHGGRQANVGNCSTEKTDQDPAPEVRPAKQTIRTYLRIP
jgi:hypothetical protein